MKRGALAVLCACSVAHAGGGTWGARDCAAPAHTHAGWQARVVQVQGVSGAWLAYRVTLAFTNTNRRAASLAGAGLARAEDFDNVRLHLVGAQDALPFNDRAEVQRFVRAAFAARETRLFTLLFYPSGVTALPAARALVVDVKGGSPLRFVLPC